MVGKLDRYMHLKEVWFLLCTCRLDSVLHPTAGHGTDVVGMSGYYPGSGVGICGFQKSLTSEEDLPRTVPCERWDLERYYVPEARGDLSMYVRMASFVEDLEEFDANLFR